MTYAFSCFACLNLLYVVHGKVSFLLGRDLAKRGFEQEGLDYLTAVAAPWGRQVRLRCQMRFYSKSQAAKTGQSTYLAHVAEIWVDIFCNNRLRMVDARIMRPLRAVMRKGMRSNHFLKVGSTIGALLLNTINASWSRSDYPTVVIRAQVFRYISQYSLKWVCFMQRFKNVVVYKFLTATFKSGMYPSNTQTHTA